MMMRRRLSGMEDETVGRPNRQRSVKKGHSDGERNDPAVHG